MERRRKQAPGARVYRIYRRAEDPLQPSLSLLCVGQRRHLQVTSPRGVSRHRQGAASPCVCITQSRDGSANADCQQHSHKQAALGSTLLQLCWDLPSTSICRL